MTTTNRTKRLAAAVLATSVMLTLAAVITPVQPAAGAAELTGTFTSKIQANTRTAAVLKTADAPLGNAVTPATRTVTTIARPAATKTTNATNASGTRRTRAAAPAATKQAASAPAPATNELAKARSILAGYIARYPSLSGTTVTFGDARGHQAICYYKSGRIVISSSHTASLERIIGHEIWHVIDWRDNGVIDWGENVPPR